MMPWSVKAPPRFGIIWCHAFKTLCLGCASCDAMGCKGSSLVWHHMMPPLNNIDNVISMGHKLSQYFSLVFLPVNLSEFFKIKFRFFMSFIFLVHKKLKWTLKNSKRSNGRLCDRSSDFLFRPCWNLDRAFSTPNERLFKALRSPELNLLWEIFRPEIDLFLLQNWPWQRG